MTINVEAIGLLPRENNAILGRIGTIIARLAGTQFEIELAQKLRFDVFFSDRGLVKNHTDGVDADAYDPHCAHLLLLDTAVSGSVADQLVGTARLLLDENASLAGGFYSENEFTLRGLRTRQAGRRFLEIGRTCVKPQWRSKRTAELMWQGIWAFALDHQVDVLVGCASFNGTVPAAHAMSLSFMHHYHRAKGAWRVKALPELSSSMDLMPLEAINLKQAMLAMPPLLKGYLRVGAMIGNDCVVDHDFGTTDVFVVLPVANIAKRYIRHYRADASRFAA